MNPKTLLALALLPAFASAIWAMPALADVVTVVNVNGAGVFNEVGAGADSGSNSADGGSGGDGGDGGNVIVSSDDNTGGNGGSGGDGGNGGIVITGNATAGALADNTVNWNDTLVDDCACDDDDDDEDFVTVVNLNGAGVLNGVGAGADSGDNSGDGGSGGSAGDAGDVIFSDDDNVSGDGGDGGSGGDGSFLTITGNASAGAAAFNVVNTNITRILH